MGDLPDHQTFACRVGETFLVRPPESPALSVTLVEAKALPPPGVEGIRAEPFSLLFRAYGPEYLPQSIYRLEHAGMGDLELFLVPIGPDEVGMRFEAIIA